MKKFEFDAQEINSAARSFESADIENIIGFLEQKAIGILEDAGICDPMYYNPPYKSDSEGWRLFWLNEASHQCDDFDPVGSAGEHLDQAQRAAVNVLMSASALRECVREKSAGEAAALAMILITDAFMGGLLIDLADMTEKLSQASGAKRLPYERGIGKRQAVFDAMKGPCVQFAAEQWQAEPDRRMGEMVDAVLEHLRATVATGKRPGDLPGDAAIREWLKDAHEAGAIKIPEGASRPGRGRKTK